MSLSPEGRERLLADLQRSLTGLGYDRESWSADLLVKYADAAYGVTLSVGRTHALLAEAEGEAG